MIGALSALLGASPARPSVVELFQKEYEGTGAPANTVFFDAAWFKQGDLPTATPLLVRRVDNNAEIRTQLDRKTTWPDGSCKYGLVALEMPSVADTVKLMVKFMAGETHSSPGTTLSLAAGLTGRSAVVGIDPTGAEAEWVYDVKAAALASTDYWRGPGPLVIEVRTKAYVPQAKMGASGVSDSTGGRVVCDLTYTKNGDLFVDSRFANDSMNALPNATGLIAANFAPRVTIDGVNTFTAATTVLPTYTAGLRRGGRTLAGGAANYWSFFLRPPAQYLWEAAALPLYDVALGYNTVVSTSHAADRATSDWNVWLGAATLLQYRNLVTGGPTGDNENLYGIPFGTAGACWTIDGNRHSQMYAMDQAEQMSNEQAHYWDYTNNCWVNFFHHPTVILHPNTINPDPTGALFGADDAHTPQVQVAPILYRGRRAILDELQSKAAFLTRWGYYEPTSGNPFLPANLQVRSVGYAINIVLWSHDFAPVSEQPYATAWEAALNTGLSYLVARIASWTTALGETYGYIPAQLNGDFPNTVYAGEVKLWQQDLVAMALSLAARRGWTDAETFLTYMANYVAGGLVQSVGDYPIGLVSYEIANGPVPGAAPVPWITWADLDTNNPASPATPAAVSGGNYSKLQLSALCALKTALPGNSVVADAWTYLHGTEATLTDASPAAHLNDPKLNIIPSVGDTRV